ncbi:MAG: transglycosylase SLT domain-containing protein [Smithellaceae bacterium]|nr:transglycosylase SLT domain-containing protein [Smithellaceae bacterium]
MGSPLKVLRAEVILSFVFSLFIFSAAFAAPSPTGKKTEAIPDLMAAASFDGPINFCGEVVPLESPEISERLETEFLMMLWDRAQVIIWMKRSGRYMPSVEEELRKKGLPDDLKYLMVIESSMRPHAGSSKGAVGFWQFIEATGKEYGLCVDDRIDQRRNIFASTGAALDHLKDLHDLFGSWALAAAAYNMGRDGLRTEIITQGTNDYFRLYLPLETQRYVFRALAAKLILSDPARYGFTLSKESLYPIWEGDNVDLICADNVPLKVVAQAARCDFKTIKDLNPEVRGYYLSKGRHSLLVPKGAGDGFSDRFAKALEAWHRDRRENIYTVKKGDTLASIAAEKGVTVRALMIWNEMDSGRISPGEKLYLEK